MCHFQGTSELACGQVKTTQLARSVLPQKSLSNKTISTEHMKVPLDIRKKNW